MVTLDSARRLLAEHARPLPAVEVALPDALGCRLAESPCADADLPAADVSAMDGYAAYAEDLAAGAPLPVAFEVPAGQPPPSLPRGTVARILTGAVVPEGADTVVQQEQADVRPDGEVRLATAEAGQFIRRKGELCTVASCLAAIGDVITPQRIGLLGAAGASRVRVTPQPRVALLSTGSELVPVHEPPNFGQIRDSNGVMLTALAKAAGFEVTWSARVADDLGELRDALAKAAAEADLIVTCGGVSVGDYDLVPQALNDLGGQTLFHNLPIKPGRPVLAARLGEAWVVGLPGNPVSSLVGWRLLAQPLGKTLAGDLDALAEPPTPVVLTKSVRNDGHRTLLALAQLERVDPTPTATVLPWKGSHDVVTMARANALVLVPAGTAYAAGAVAGCYPLD
jgi:molybdopterin molybdotransferase